MHFLGYQNCKVKIGSMDILLHHSFTIKKENKYDSEIKEIYNDTQFLLILSGHTHQNSIYTNSNKSTVVNVPALFDPKKKNYSSAYEITMDSINIELSNLIISDNVDILSKIKYPNCSNCLAKKYEKSKLYTNCDE